MERLINMIKQMCYKWQKMPFLFH